MKAARILQLTLFNLLTCLADATLADQKATPPRYDEADLKKRYDAFLLGLDYVKVGTDYPKVIKDLLSRDSARQVTPVKTLGETADPAVIPWLVP